MVDLSDIVDLKRYPIDALDSAAGRALIARTRDELVQSGACDLPGFLQQNAVERVVEGVEGLSPFTMQQTHNIEFSGIDPDLLGVDDPLRVHVRSAKGCLAYNRIPAESPLRTLFESKALTQFVGAAVEIDPLFRHADEIGALNVMVHDLGDELGWHFDNADFVVTLMLRPASEGGEFEYAPLLRTPTDANTAGVRALLAGDRAAVRSIAAEAGTLALFRGHYSPHRVTPVRSGKPRINAVLSYAGTPDARLSASARQLFYGVD